MTDHASFSRKHKRRRASEKILQLSTSAIGPAPHFLYGAVSTNVSTIFATIFVSIWWDILYTNRLGLVYWHQYTDLGSGLCP